VYERRSGAGWLLLVMLATPLILGIAWFYTGWQSSQRVLPDGVTMAGLPVGGMTRQQALNAVSQAFNSTVLLHYQDEQIPLAPELVDLALDQDATAENLNTVLLGQSGLRGFIQYIGDTVLGRESQAREIQPVFSYSRERLDSFLLRVAQQYDHEPREAVPLPEAGTFRPPQPGRRLNIEASLPLVLVGLLSASEREVTLVVEVLPVLDPTFDVLEETLAGQLADFSGVVSLFIKDMRSGQELCYNCNVAFSGMQLLNPAIVLELYRNMTLPTDPQVTALVSQTLLLSQPFAADQLLAGIGAGDPYTGSLQVTALLESLHMQNSFLVAPYTLRENLPTPQISTPANAQGNLDTAPDPYAQTTPLDMGLLFEGLYQCAHDGGILRALYPEALSPEKCQSILYWLGRNRSPVLLGTHLPANEVLVAHESGWSGATYADVALVRSPNSDFVIAAFIYQPAWLTWEESQATFATIGRLTYRYFNP